MVFTLKFELEQPKLRRTYLCLMKAFVLPDSINLRILTVLTFEYSVSAKCTSFKIQKISRDKQASQN